MNDMNKFLLTVLIIGALSLTACDRGVPGKNSIANPASEFCEHNGGKLVILTAPDGSQIGQCTINGKVCEEWALFRGECKDVHVCTDDQKKQVACTMDYNPVCGSDGKTYGNGCGACSASVTLWTAGECV